MLPALAQLGERLRPVPLGLKANAVEYVGGRWVGGADPRSEGVAMSVAGERAPIRRMSQVPGAPHE
jgi:gamma-glutamyltranspeptidase/glutathione hydrolase